MDFRYLRTRVAQHALEWIHGTLPQAEIAHLRIVFLVAQLAERVTHDTCGRSGESCKRKRDERQGKEVFTASRYR